LEEKFEEINSNNLNEFLLSVERAHAVKPKVLAITAESTRRKLCVTPTWDTLAEHQW
jgi:hypothetical protein